MLWWLVDNANLVFLVLGLVALVLAVRWSLTRRGAYLAGLGVTFTLIAVVFALTLFVVTDRRRLVQRVEEIARLFNPKDLDRAFDHMTDTIRLEMSGWPKPITLPKSWVKQAAQRGFRDHNIQGIHVWNIGVEKVDRPSAVV